jgi:hypothetical protein
MPVITPASPPRYAYNRKSTYNTKIGNTGNLRQQCPPQGKVPMTKSRKQKLDPLPHRANSKNAKRRK